MKTTRKNNGNRVSDAKIASSDDSLVRLLTGVSSQKEGNGKDDAAKRVKDHFPLAIPKKIVASHGVREASRMMSQAIREIGKKPHEWYGFILFDRNDPDFVVRNMVFPSTMNVWPGSLQWDGTQHGIVRPDIEKLSAKDNRQYAIIGSLHSHSSGMPGFSTTDVEYTEKFLNGMRFTTEQRSFGELKLFEQDVLSQVRGNKIYLTSDLISDALLSFGVKDENGFQEMLMRYGLAKKGPEGKEVDTQQFIKDVLEAVHVHAFEPKVVGFCYGIVVNDADDTPYGMIMKSLRKPLTDTNSECYFSNPITVPVEFTEVEGDMSLSIEAAREIVSSRVTFNKEYLGRYISKGAFSEDDEEYDIKGGYVLGRHAQTVNPQLRSVLGRVWTPQSAAAYQHSTPATASRSVNTAAGAKKTLMKALPSEPLSIEEIVEGFVFDALKYISQGTRINHPYSQYLDRVLSRIGEISVNKPSSLGEAIQLEGYLWADRRMIDKPNMEIYAAGLVSLRIEDGLKDPLKGYELQFMHEFQSANNQAARNRALRKWVPYFMDLEKKDLQDVPPQPPLAPEAFE